MGDCVRCADGKCSVQHAGEKRHSAAPSSLVIPICPDERVARMVLRHDCKNDDGGQASDQHYKKSELLDNWEESVEKDRYCNAHPDDYRESDENVPRLDGVVGVVDGIHLDNKFRHDVDD